MADPQPGLFLEETAQHYHVEWDVSPDVSPEALTAAIGAARRAAASQLRGPNSVWGFDPVLWDGLSGSDVPAGVHRFAGVSGPGGNAPVTQHSIWLWVHGNAHEKVWQSAYSANAALSGLTARYSEQAAYVAFDNRDPIGFIDGTENPPLDRALAVALFPDGGAGAGGSAVLVQKWVHDLSAFYALPQAQQEAIIGRTRGDSTELGSEVMPPTSHVSRNVIEEPSGMERKIFRRNTPFASLAEAGTMFIGATNDPPLVDLMLDRMFGAASDGFTDHLTRFSKPVSGSYYFVPSMQGLRAVFGPLGEAAAATEDADRGGGPPPGGGSLGIGSLRQHTRDFADEPGEL